MGNVCLNIFSHRSLFFSDIYLNVKSDFRMLCIRFWLGQISWFTIGGDIQKRHTMIFLNSLRLICEYSHFLQVIAQAHLLQRSSKPTTVQSQCQARVVSEDYVVYDDQHFNVYKSAKIQFELLAVKVISQVVVTSSDKPTTQLYRHNLTSSSGRLCSRLHYLVNRLSWFPSLSNTAIDSVHKKSNHYRIYWYGSRR